MLLLKLRNLLPKPFLNCMLYVIIFLIKLKIFIVLNIHFYIFIIYDNIFV